MRTTFNFTVSFSEINGKVLFIYLSLFSQMSTGVGCIQLCSTIKGAGWCGEAGSICGRQTMTKKGIRGHFGGRQTTKKKYTRTPLGQWNSMEAASAAHMAEYWADYIEWSVSLYVFMAAKCPRQVCLPVVYAVCVFSFFFFFFFLQWTCILRIKLKSNQGGRGGGLCDDDLDHLDELIVK